MIFSLRKWLVRLKFIVLFLVCTAILYYFFQFIASWIEPAQRYKQPVGKAVKVFQHQPYSSEPSSVAGRLIFFYWYGE